MSADQTATFRPGAVTQRDGSKLANSNCRMASIATGLAYDTLGKKTSTGGKMRTFTDDQSGGTDAGDAREAWSRGYGEALDVQDGNAWGQVLVDLRAHRMVHLDVWHATAGGCVSGTGRYGHTIAVLPDCKDDAWLVSDPWCLPARWQRISEARLRAGAEEWGRRVYGAATSGPGERPSIAQLQAAAKELMRRFHAGGSVDTSDDPGDTGGGQLVMYTATVGHPPAVAQGSAMSIKFNMNHWTTAKEVPVYLDTSGSNKITAIAAGKGLVTLGYRALEDSDGYDPNWLAARVTTGGLIPGDQPAINAILWVKRADLPASANGTPAAWDTGVWTLMGQPTGVYPCPPPVVTPPPPSTDCSLEISAAVKLRDEEWERWLMLGSPGQKA